MRSRLIVAGMAMALAATPALASTGSAGASDSSTAKVKRSAFQMYLSFDAKESLRRGTRVSDASGKKHGGTVQTAEHGKLRSVKGSKRRGADFPNRCGSCGRAIIEVQDRKGLDPARRDFTFGASIKVTKSQARSGSNIVQKGYFHEIGGQFKLQLNAGGIPSCVFFGSAGRSKITSSVGIANRKWHRVACTRIGDSVRLSVDGRLRASEAIDVGRISNAAPIRLGGKKITPRNKQFHGVLDTVYLRFLPAR